MLEERNYCVYKHTSPSGKVYIGITCQEPEKRWNYGRGYHQNKHFTNAIKKYGWENFTHEILFTNLSKEDACQKEIELIAFYKSNQRELGYNCSSGGEISAAGCTPWNKGKKGAQVAWNKGKHHSEDSKRKMSESSKGQVPWNKGQKMSEEFCKKISEAGKGRDAWNKGRKWSEESKNKMSESHKGQTAWNKNKKLSDEHKRNLSTSHKGQKAWNKGKTLTEKQKNIILKVSDAYKEYKASGGTLTWNEFQKEYSKQIA